MGERQTGKTDFKGWTRMSVLFVSLGVRKGMGRTAEGHNSRVLIQSISNTVDLAVVKWLEGKGRRKKRGGSNK